MAYNFHFELASSYNNSILGGYQRLFPIRQSLRIKSKRSLPAKKKRKGESKVVNRHQLVCVCIARRKPQPKIKIKKATFQLSKLQTYRLRRLYEGKSSSRDTSSRRISLSNCRRVAFITVCITHNVQTQKQNKLLGCIHTVQIMYCIATHCWFLNT